MVASQLLLKEWILVLASADLSEKAGNPDEKDGPPHADLLGTNRRQSFEMMAAKYHCRSSHLGSHQWHRVGIKLQSKQQCQRH